MELRYKQVGDYLYPEITLQEQTNYRIGKYGDLHLEYIKKHRRGTYSHLLMSGRLNEYLHSIDEQAREMRNRIIDRLAAERGVNEALKAENALLWVQEMNNCKADAEEIVMREIVYR